MRKLFEKYPMLHFTFVLAMVSIVCGLVIGGANAITAPVIENNLLKAKVESFEKVLRGIDSFDEVTVGQGYPKSIRSIAKGYNESKETIGYIYEAYDKNSYGSITIVVSVGMDGKVLGADFLAIEQSLNVPGTRTNLSLYVGSDITNLEPKGDLVSGVTGSLSTLQGLLSDVATAHGLTKGEVVVDPLDEAYGKGFTLEVDGTFTETTHVTAKSFVKQGANTVGYMFSLSGNGEYIDGSSADLVMEIYFNADDKIVKVLLPEDSYKHSPGGFRNKNLKYVELFTGLTKAEIKSVVEGSNTDITAGASNTRALLDELLDAFLSEVV